MAAGLGESHEGDAIVDSVKGSEGSGVELPSTDGEAPLVANALREKAAVAEGGSLPLLTSEPVGCSDAAGEIDAAAVPAPVRVAMPDGAEEGLAAGEKEPAAPVSVGLRTDIVGQIVGGNRLAVGLGVHVTKAAVAVGATVSLTLAAALKVATGVDDAKGVAVGMPPLAL